MENLTTECGISKKIVIIHCFFSHKEKLGF